MAGVDWLMIQRSIGLLVLATLVACAAKPRSVKTMPHPDGCFIQVWDEERFTGMTQFVNGPRSYSTLDALPNKDGWGMRIRSVQAGPAATVIAWTGKSLAGASIVLQPEHEYSTLPHGFDRAIQSMSISCSLRATN